MAQSFNQNFGELGVEVIHHMPDGDGIYIKETVIPKGRILLAHKHTFSHKSVLVSGIVELIVDGGRAMILHAPSIISIPSGKSHRVTSVTNAVWYCVHATTETDPNRIDHTLVEHDAHKTAA